MDDFGGRLRQAREQRGMSLRQIATTTRIATAALEALERNDISKLPGGIFSRAFVRSYAVEVGLDPEATVREFLDRFQQEPAPTSETLATAVPEEERAFLERRRRAVRLAVGAVALALVLIVIVIAVVRARSRAQRDVPAPDASTAIAPPAATSSVPQPTPVAAAGLARPAPAAAAGTIRLEIAPTANCWVSVTADGRKVFARVLSAGQKESVDIAREAIVEVGDAGVFSYTINGRPGRSLGAPGQVRTVRLTAATVDQFVR
ncbi:MAG TPA: helix-turn-helix domain-containing protein [Vicinamibacterales bacterium]|jgi:cytoskeletal protein RodZ